MTVPAELLAWDTAFFGFRVARALNTDAFGPGAGQALVDWCVAAQVRWLYALVPPTPAASREAEAHRFTLTDIRMELSAPLERMAAALPTGVRPFQASDIAVLRALARESHRDSRFFADAGLPEPQAALLFERWIERDCEPAADRWAGVATMHGTPVGYLTAHVDAQRHGWVRLVAVAAAARGRGLGSALLSAAGRWMADRGAVDARVVTQGRNLAAQRLYQQAGFRTESLQLWYHRWFPT